MPTILEMSRLSKVRLRDCWQNEAVAFAPWLAEDENLDLLSDAVGMQLELIDTEIKVGPFRDEAKHWIGLAPETSLGTGPQHVHIV